MVLIIFVMNVSAAYSACCVAVPVSDVVPALATPCHQSEETEQNSSSIDGCSLCAQIVLPIHEETAEPTFRILIEFTIPAAIPKRFSPPYRPPILLS